MTLLVILGSAVLTESKKDFYYYLLQGWRKVRENPLWFPFSTFSSEKLRMKNNISNKTSIVIKAELSWLSPPLK